MLFKYLSYSVQGWNVNMLYAAYIARTVKLLQSDKNFEERLV